MGHKSGEFRQRTGEQRKFIWRNCKKKKEKVQVGDNYVVYTSLNQQMIVFLNSGYRALFVNGKVKN